MCRETNGQGWTQARSHASHDGRSDVLLADDELADGPVLVASIWKVSPDDQGIFFAANSFMAISKGSVSPSVGTRTVRSSCGVASRYAAEACQLQWTHVNMDLLRPAAMRRGTRAISTYEIEERECPES